jgi:hypothetical protein
MLSASQDNSTNNPAETRIPGNAPLTALSTVDLEDALLEAIVITDLDGSDPRFAEVDEYFADDDALEEEVEYRSDLYRLLFLLSAS